MASAAIRRPLVSLAVALAAGIAAGGGCPGYPLVAGLAAGVAAAGTLHGIRRDRARLFAPLILTVTLGYLSLHPWITPRRPADHLSHIVGEPAQRLTGRVIESPRVERGRQKLVVALDAAPVRGRIRLTVLGTQPVLAPGDRIRFRARLRALANFNNPGGFDYRRYMALRRVRASAFVRAEAIEPIGRAPPRAGGALGAFRRRVSARIAAAASPDEAAVMAALTVGDRSRVTDRLREAFNRAGVGHLLAISGLHVGLVAALAYAAWMHLLVWFPTLVRQDRVRAAATVLTAGVVWAYGLLAGMSPSTQRAVLMISVYLLAVLAARQHDLPTTVALAALVILAVHPPALFSLSFQLSFAAVGWILAGAALLPRPTRAAVPAPAARLGRWALQFGWVSLWAILGTLPLAARYFNQVSLVGLPANFVCVPLVGMGVVPLALAGTALVGIWPAAATLVFDLCGWLLAPVLGFIGWLAGQPASAVTVFTPRILEIGLYYLLLGLGVAAGRRVRGLGCPFSAGRLALAAGLVLALLGADAFYWGQRRYWHRDLRATVLDVGQGAAAVLELPGGRVALVDGGGFGDPLGFDVGRRIVAPFLHFQKIRTVDIVVLSHPNADHLNGLLWVLEHFRVGEVWSNHEPADTLGYRLFLETLVRRRLSWPPFAQLAERDREPAGLTVLYPPADFLCRRRHEPWRDRNNNSLVVRADGPPGAIVLPGDIEAPAEAELAGRAGPALAAAVLVVPHHGSRTSCTPALLAAVRPRVAVISCGRRNRYGMPHPQVLERLRRSGARVWRTDRHGAVTVILDADGMTVRPFLRPTAGTP